MPIILFGNIYMLAHRSTHTFNYEQVQYHDHTHTYTPYIISNLILSDKLNKTPEISRIFPFIFFY